MQEVSGFTFRVGSSPVDLILLKQLINLLSSMMCQFDLQVEF